MAYADLILYLESFGLPREVCKDACERYEVNSDMEGCIDYVLRVDDCFEASTCS